MHRVEFISHHLIDLGSVKAMTKGSMDGIVEFTTLFVPNGILDS